jgi:Beta/Gamma crystallin
MIPAPGKPKTNNTMPHVIVFEHANFHGAHKHVFGSEANLNAGDDSFFNDRISSMVVLEGRWDFFIDSNHTGKLGNTLGPGQYPSVTNALGGGTNDKISSLRPV